MNDKNQIILGPPGTGKTHTLLNHLDDELASGVDPRRVCFVAFTKKAADVAKSRVTDPGGRFKLSNADLPYFRTIHSLAFRQLGVRRDQVMQRTHYHELGEKLGMDLSVGGALGDGSTYGMSREERMMFIEGLARVKQEDLKKAWTAADEDDIDWWELERYSRALKDYKSSRLVIDYTDMIEQLVEQHRTAMPDIDVLFVDEAQDLSEVQWRAIEKLSERAKRVYFAGDDDQAIFQWAGADVSKFIDLEGKEQVLNQSKRIPSSVHPIAESIARQISRRRKKDYKPRDTVGSVKWYGDPDEVDMSQGTWLLLARNGYMLQELEENCVRNGFSFQSVSRSPLQSESLKALKSWENLRKGNLAPIEEAMTIAKFATPGKGIGKNTRELLRKSEKDVFVSLDELCSSYEFRSRAVWFEFLDRIPAAEVDYFRAALRKHETLFKKPRITISTIHAAKGDEAENVLLLTDMSYRTYTEMSKYPDDEHRVWYVGASRCLEALHLIAPRTNLCYDL